LYALVGGAVIVAVSQFLCGRAEVIVGGKGSGAGGGLWGQGKHIEIKAPDVALAEKSKSFRDGGVGVLRFCGQAWAEEDTVHE
jgi:hypothetical protein